MGKARGVRHTSWLFTVPILTTTSHPSSWGSVKFAVWNVISTNNIRAYMGYVRFTHSKNYYAFKRMCPTATILVGTKFVDIIEIEPIVNAYGKISGPHWFNGKLKAIHNQQAILGHSIPTHLHTSSSA